MDTTSMFSDTPLRPGRRQQIPRTLRRIFTPAFDAAYSARIMSSSTSAFIFARMRPGWPSSARRRSRSIMERILMRRAMGAMVRHCIDGGSEKPVMALKKAERSRPSVSSEDRRPMSV